MAAIDMNVCEQARTTALSDRLDAAIPRQPDPTQRAHVLTIRTNDLPVLRRPPRLRGRRRHALIAKGSQITPIRLSTLTRTVARAGNPHFNTGTYAELGRRAARQTATRGGALVGATFRHRADRDVFADAFGDAAPLVFVECRAPARVLAERAARRDRQPTRVSDASLSVVMRESTTWEPLDELAPEAHVTLRRTAPSRRSLRTCGPCSTAESAGSRRSGASRHASRKRPKGLQSRYNGGVRA